MPQVVYFGKANCVNIIALSTFALISLELLEMLVNITPSTYAGNYFFSLVSLKIPLYIRLAEVPDRVSDGVPE